MVFVVKQNTHKEKNGEKVFAYSLIFTLAITACTAGNEFDSLIGSWNLTSYGPVASAAPAVADSGPGSLSTRMERSPATPVVMDLGATTRLKMTRLRLIRLLPH